MHFNKSNHARHSLTVVSSDAYSQEFCELADIPAVNHDVIATGSTHSSLVQSTLSWFPHNLLARFARGVAAFMQDNYTIGINLDLLSLGHLAWVVWSCHLAICFLSWGCHLLAIHFKLSFNYKLMNQFP